MTEEFKKMEFTDDFMFRKVMENKSICKRMLEILLDIQIDHIENLTPEFTIENVFNSRGVRLDVYVKDSNRVFDVEMQTNIKGDEGLRARYYQGAIDMNLLNRGEHYRKLKNSYIIFLCTEDPFGDGDPVYVFETLSRKRKHITINDGVLKYFFNASAAHKIRGNKEVKNLLSYISTHIPKSDFTKEIEEEVKLSSGDQKWRKGLMTFEMMLEEKKDESFAQGLEQGIEQGAYNNKLETAEKLLAINLSVEQIAQVTGLPLATIET